MHAIIRETKTFSTPLLFIIVVLSSICSNVYATSEAPDVKEKIWNWYFKGQIIEKALFKSEITQVTYPYHVYLPASYANSTEKIYPVIYVLDGQWSFRGFAYSLERDKRDVIVIAIEQGGPEDSNRRMIDYSLPGATLYLDFFRQEFLPLVESIYRIDANDRSFQGTSISGVVTTALLFLDDHKAPLFKNYIAYDPSYCHEPNLMQELVAKRLQIDKRIEANLYITTALPLGNNFCVMNFIQSLEKYAIPSLSIYHSWYIVSHNGILGASIDDTLDLIYGKPSL